MFLKRKKTSYKNETKAYPFEGQRRLGFDYEVKGDRLIIDLDFFLHRYDRYGKKVELNILYGTNVRHQNGIDKGEKIYSESFVVDSHKKQIIIDISDIQRYSYNGKHIDLDFNFVLKINDGFFFDTKVHRHFYIKLDKKVKKPVSAKRIINPYDMYDLFKNFKALAFFKKLIILFFLLFLITFMVMNLLFFLQALILVLIFLFGFKGIYSYILKGYMSFNLRDYKFSSDINKEYNLSDLVTGKSKVDLRNVEIRVVASNLEKGQYTTGSGKNRRTVTFKNPVNGIILHTEKIDFIQKNTDISSYLKGKFSFKEVYKELYPPYNKSSTHGVGVIWKIQLLHRDFIDQEIEGPTGFMKYENFIK